MKEVRDEDVYFHSAHIACASLYAPRHVQGAAFCVFTQGHNIPQINGSVIKRKLTQLRDHGCFACGSVPIADDNDPNTQGLLTLNYVLNKNCQQISNEPSPICKPSIPDPARLSNPQPPTATLPAFQLFNISEIHNTAVAEE